MSGFLRNSEGLFTKYVLERACVKCRFNAFYTVLPTDKKAVVLSKTK